MARWLKLEENDRIGPGYLDMLLDAADCLASEDAGAADLPRLGLSARSPVEVAMGVLGQSRAPTFRE